MNEPSFRKQLLAHDPGNGSYDDCHRTVLANLCGLLPEGVAGGIVDAGPVRRIAELEAALASAEAARDFLADEIKSETARTAAVNRASLAAMGCARAALDRADVVSEASPA